MTEVYCLKCGKMVQAEVAGMVEVHEFNYRTEYGTEYDWCDMPLGYTMSAPPEVPIDFELQEEPSDDELELMLRNL